MKIATVGRGNIGGGLGDRWERAGHDVTRLGQDGGDVSDADALLLAVPGGAVADALAKVTGLDGKTVIDATNLIGSEPPDGFASNAEYVKSKTNGPTSKAFNLNFARNFGEIDNQPVRPSQLYAGDEEARETTEQLIRDAGFEPARVGGLDKASTLEGAIGVFFGVSQEAGAPPFYRLWAPGELSA
jgi:8-hydroxy-5-deazaflavin:NADPH oxidoreductase